MGRTALVTILLLATSALVPSAAGAAAGDTVDLTATFRGDTPWLTAATVVITGSGEHGDLVLDGALGTAQATHPAPAGPGDPTGYDLTDVVPVPADQAFDVTAPNGASVTFGGLTLGFVDPDGKVVGTAAPNDEVDVTLVSGDQSLSTTVTAGSAGAWSADFAGTFDGSWEFGTSATATVTRTSGDGTEVRLHVARVLPDADITTRTLPGTEPPVRTSFATFSDITPGLTFQAVGEPATVTLATATASFDPDGQGTVAHQGRTITIDVPADLGVADVDPATDTVTGTAPAGAQVDVLLASDGGVAELTTTADGAGNWSVTAGHDITAWAQVDAAIDHTDGARHHAQLQWGEQPDSADAVLAVLLLPADALVLLPFLNTSGDTWDVTAVTPGGTSTARVSSSQLLDGLSADLFDPPVDFAGGMDITIEQDGSQASVRIPALTWTVAQDGAVSGSTDAGQDVSFLAEIPVAGITQRQVTGASGDGSFTFPLGSDFVPGTEVTAAILPELDDTEDFVVVIDQRLAPPRTHRVGDSGDRAPGLGNNDLVLESLGLLAAGTDTPTAWRADALVGAGGPADLDVVFPSEGVTSDSGLFGLESLTPLSNRFPVSLRSGGEELTAAPAPLTVYVPVNVDGELGTVVSDPAVVVDTGSGFEPVPAEQVTVCLASSDPGCDDFPVPYVQVTEAVPGTYAVVDDRTVPNTLIVDRVSGEDRIGTAIALSQDTFPEGGADAAIVANAYAFPDALAATPLAAAANAPILLNPQGSLHPDVEAEIERLGVDRVYVMGGEAAIARSVQVAIGRDADVTAVTRVAGSDRFATAAEAARWAVELWRANGDASAGDEAIVALGAHPSGPDRAWPDALVAGQLAGYAQAPILLVHPDGVPAVTNQALSELGTDNVLVAGGAAAIPDATMQAIGGDDVGKVRLAGSDRYGTGTRFADEATLHGASPAVVLVATGLAFPDGLAAAAAAYHQGGVLVLADGQDATRSPATLEWLQAAAGDVGLLRAVGGDSAVAPSVLDQLAAAASTPGTTVERRSVQGPWRPTNWSRLWR